jgi:hypothetical protein
MGMISAPNLVLAAENQMRRRVKRRVKVNMRRIDNTSMRIDFEKTG